MNDPAAVLLSSLKSVLDATLAVEEALSRGDVEGFERAVARRGERLEDFRRAFEDSTGAASDPPPGGLRELAECLAQTEARVQQLAIKAGARIRDELKNLQTGKRALSGYRTPPSVTPRFSDRTG